MEKTNNEKKDNLKNLMSEIAIIFIINLMTAIGTILVKPLLLKYSLLVTLILFVCIIPMYYCADNKYIIKLGHIFSILGIATMLMWVSSIDIEKEDIFSQIISLITDPEIYFGYILAGSLILSIGMTFKSIHNQNKLGKLILSFTIPVVLLIIAEFIF